MEPRRSADEPRRHGAAVLRRPTELVGLVEKDHVLMRDIGVNWDLVSGEVIIDEQAASLVDGEFLHQRGADSRRDRAII
jgi:hypothetical protein